tara:strand:+ start:98 stop:559 length:462 start_codon:yes stop_codon:yes gene_type:complete
MFRILKVSTTFIIITLLVAELTACTAEPIPRLSIQDPWTRPAAIGGNAAVYFTLVNKGNAPDTLVGASSNIAKTVGTHETQMGGNRERGNVIRMVPIPRIEVPARGRIELQPGGFHVMLVELKQDLNLDDTVSVTLLFEKSDEITVVAKVRQP